MTYPVDLFWYLSLMLGAATFLIRLSFIAVMGRWTPGESMRRVLRFIPASVLSAIIAGSVVHGMDEGGGVLLQRVPAIIAAFAVAWKSRSVSLTILFGMGCYWLLGWQISN